MRHYWKWFRILFRFFTQSVAPLHGSFLVAFVAPAQASNGDVARADLQFARESLQVLDNCFHAGTIVWRLLEAVDLKSANGPLELTNRQDAH